MIAEEIIFDNRTFYAKFECIHEPLTHLLIKQHLDRQFIIAAPLLKDNHTNYLVIEYKGEEHRRFHHLVKHLFKTIQVNDYHIYQGKDDERLQVFITVQNLSLEKATEQLQSISSALKQKMAQKWKCLPSSRLPEAYNIVTLPYNRLPND